MKYLLPRFQDIFFLSVFCGALLLGSQMLSIDSDLGRHLTVGEYILTEYRIPTTDIFSHTKSGESRPPYEWLSQVFFAASHRFLGLDGVILLTSLVIAGAFTLVYIEAARRSRLPVTALVLAILSAAAGSVHWLPRPHVVTFLLLAIWLEKLEKVREGENIPFWQIPLLMLLWANLHGGFIFGLLAWAAYFSGWVVERWLRKDLATPEMGKTLFIAGTLSLFASFITPDGWGSWQALFGNSSVYILSQTTETMPPDFQRSEMLPFLLLLLLSLLLIILNRFRLPASHIFLLAGFASLSLLMARNISLFAIASVPVLAVPAGNLPDKAQAWRRVEARFDEINRSLWGSVWAVTGVFAAVVLFFNYHIQTGSSFNEFNPHVFPVAAVQWLEDNPQTGNMFNEFNWGGYLLHRLWSRHLVFMDSQTDFYGESLTRDYSQIVNARNGWEAKMKEYEIDWVIVSNDSPLATALDWEILYQDETAAILRK
ncbi:MAG: hypothetical protein C4557_11970 [Anaerolineaceae bacterium]|jgi:hypothetical protein|nr:MAG: hypothetical protein C4557_11970 [Anaerolineaceae bacterium]